MVTLKKFHIPGLQSKVKVAQKIFLAQQLQIMVRAGVPLTGALKTLQLQTTGQRLKQILNDVEQNIEKGQTLAEAMRPHEHDFGQLMVNMIAAGEASGRLEEVLGQVYLQMKKDHEIISRVQGALIYPAIVVTAMFVIGTGMMIFVIPQLTAIFKESNVVLPLPTRILISTSTFLQKYALFIFPAMALLIWAFAWVIRQPRGRYIWHGVLLSTPIAGAIIKKVNMARFARTVSSFLKTDIPIVQTLITTADVLGNVHYREALLEAAKRLTKGVTLSEALRDWPNLFNPTILQMITVGEQSGALDDILVEAASFYEDEVAQIMTTLPSLLEPILMLLLGVGVGAMAVAIILPLYRLTEAF